MEFIFNEQRNISAIYFHVSNFLKHRAQVNFSCLLFFFFNFLILLLTFFSVLEDIESY